MGSCQARSRREEEGRNKHGQTKHSLDRRGEKESRIFGSVGLMTQKVENFLLQERQR